MEKRERGLGRELKKKIVDLDGSFRAEKRDEHA